MNLLRRIFTRIMLLTLLCAASAYAKGPSIGLDVQPVVGYERTQLLYPTQHSVDRMVYGARAIAGLLLISVEGEYIRTSSSETFSGGATSTDQADKAKLGLRSGFGLGSFINFHLRGGAQATRASYTHVSGGVSSSDPGTWVLKPYAGAGLRLGMGRKVGLTADFVAVILDTNTITNNEFQGTVALSIRLP